MIRSIENRFCLFSEFSETVQFSTLGTIPSPPEPPQLTENAVRFLTLSWLQRSSDESFTLQINDKSNHFQNIYVGTALTHTINDLYRNTEYQFRVKKKKTFGIFI